jgi:uncharacterized protein involved in exopolysaccharide biosynthesis
MIDALHAFWFYRWMIVLIAVPIIIACAAYAWLATPIYRGEVLLMPTRSDSGTGDLGSLARDLGSFAGLAGGLLAGNDLDQKREAMALLQSRSFIVDFIEQEKLMPILFPPDPKAEEPPTTWDAYRLFTEHVMDVKEDNDTGMVTLGVEWRDPVLAARWANQLVTRVNALMSARAAQESQSTIKYLLTELVKNNVVTVQQDINRLIETHINRIAMSHARVDYAFRVVDAAYPADLDQFVRPRRVLLVAFGIVMGFALGAMVALLRMVIVRTRQERGAI